MSSFGFWLNRLRAAWRRPPRDLIVRGASEVHGELERFRVARRRTGFDSDALLTALSSPSIDALWTYLASRRYIVPTERVDTKMLDRTCPGESARVLASAAMALARKVNLLGSGPVELGTPIDWHIDFKTGTRWGLGYGRRIEYTQLDRPSDVKVPWELSRLQWVIPAGQAYLLTGDERYARAVRDILEEWMAANPYGWSVNWAVTMEVALRVLTWTWLFHVFSSSSTWADASFRAKFLGSLYLHCEYTERNIERAEVNGNHYVADAAGLAVGGMFFGACPDAERWSRHGWSMLDTELPRQVLPDGVDFEASTAYHRLVTELFILPALYRSRLGLPVETGYRERLASMASFAVSYCRPDGSSPLVGDADDGRALPLGGQPLTDHRYLGGLIGAAWEIEDLKRSFAGPRSEIAWALGLDAAAALNQAAPVIPSAAFPDGGYYVMRSPRDHVFIDCGPVGFAGRGGHGHNDCLSFEAWLDGALLVTDSGAYVYTADYRARNRFRGTAAHNTPVIDKEEQNRFVRPEQLWTLRDDAHPTVITWRTEDTWDVLRGHHDGYKRLPRPVIPVRTVVLDRTDHRLVVFDEFDGTGEHHVGVPFHLACGIRVIASEPGELRLEASGRAFRITWSDPSEWTADVQPSLVSPSYGIAEPSYAIVFSRQGPLRSLLVALAPADGSDLLGEARRLIDRAR